MKSKKKMDKSQTHSKSKIDPKLIKLRYLLENSDIKLLKKSNNSGISEKKQGILHTLNSSKLNVNISKDLSLYFSIIQKPINLLFSIDQFIFEFSKKTYQQRKTGEFFQQLKERKKLSIFYGHITRKQLINLFNKVKKTRGYYSKNILSLLESRLDVVIYRSGFAKTIAEAQQLIKHKKIKVNHKFVTIPSFFINPGDVISMNCLNTQFYDFLNLKNQGDLKKNEKISSGSFPNLKKKLEPLNKFGNNRFYKNNIFQQNKVSNLYSNFTKYLDYLLFPQIENKNKFRTKLIKSSTSKFLKFGTTTEKNSTKLLTNKFVQRKSLFHNNLSKLFCKLLIQLLSTKIKSRSYWNLNTEQFYSNQRNLQISHEKCPLVLDKPFLILLKWKFFLKKKNLIRTSNKIKTNSINNPVNSFSSKNIKHGNVNNYEFLVIGNGYLQKKPLFWNQNLLNLKKNKNFYLLKNSKFLSNQEKVKYKYLPEENYYLKNNYSNKKKKVGSFFNKVIYQIKNLKSDSSNLKKYDILLYRKSFFVFLKNLNNYKKFSNLVDFILTKFLFQKSLSKTKSLFSPNLSFRVTRPVNLEISYNLLTIVYLYSPQRINYPFYINLDLIKRSLR